MELIKTLTGDFINIKYIIGIRKYEPEDCYVVWTLDVSTPYKISNDVIQSLLKNCKIIS